MNVKGLKLNRQLARLLNKNIDSINYNNLKGIDYFNSFSWNGFSKEEFKNLLKLFVFLDDSGVFNIFPDTQTFIFNFSTDVTEIDITTVAKKNNKTILVDIETKNGSDKNLEKKIIEQIQKRKEDHLPQLLKSNPFITLGFVNEEFIKGYYFDGESFLDIANINRVKEIMNTFSEYKNVEEYLTQTSNIASISKVWRDIRYETYNYYKETNYLYSFLIDKVEKTNALFIYGHAGTGKSILALKIFSENDNAKLLMLNSKLYYSLSLGEYYKKKRATYSTKDFLKFIDKESISVVDECQRLTTDTMAEIISNSKITYFFGDERQACFPNNNLLNAKELKKNLTKEYNFNVLSKEIKKSRRYSDAVDKSLGFLTGKNNNIKDVRLPADYQIKLFYDEHEFLEYYELLNGIKKIYVPINQITKKEMNIDNISFKLAEYNFDSFSILPESQNYYGTTYHALSFDVDHCFVFLENVHMISLDKKQLMFYDSSCRREKSNDIELFLNELNVLFTRGKKSLNIYVNDIETYLYLKLRVSKLT